MSNKESNKKNQRKIKQVTRAKSMSAALLRTQAPPRFSLYRFVYESMTSAVLCFVLIASFFSQGVSLVFADEITSGDELVAIPLETTSSEESPPEETTPGETAPAEESNIVVPEAQVPETASSESVPAEPEVVPEAEAAPLSDLNSEPSESSVVDTEDLPEEVVVDETIPQGTTDTPSAEAGSDAETNDPVIDDTTDTLGSDSGGDPVPEGEDSSSGDVSDVEDTTLQATSTASTTTASTSELIGPGITDPVGTNFTDSGFMFSKSECTELASGSFYCLEPRVNVLDDALFAAPDKDGDLEIFLVRNGTQTQVTDNFVDDAAPFFDQNSETIVWHRLIDDRYQIISYELASGLETQLTKNGTNNMEPVRQGKYTVWQRWVGNNWDIVLFDGQKETQVSHASAHDIAPYIHGALVVWNRYGSTGEKTIEMYDIASETYVTVDDPEGLSVTNPRMVLVYDQMHPNGDIITKGYDMIARKFIQLDTLPRDLPDEIPESDPTSETRALIQSKPTVKGDEIVETQPTSGGEPPLPQLGSTTTEPMTLDMSQASTTINYEEVVDSQPVELSGYDLVIEPLGSSTEMNGDSVQE